MPLVLVEPTKEFEPAALQLQILSLPLQSFRPHWLLRHSQVYSFASRGNIKALMEQEPSKLVEAILGAVENVKELVREMTSLRKRDIKGCERSYKEGQDTLKAV